MRKKVTKYIFIGAIIVIIAFATFFIVFFVSLSNQFKPKWHSFIFDTPGGYSSGPFDSKEQCLIYVKQALKSDKKYIKAICGFGHCGDEYDDIMPNCDEMVTIYPENL